MICGSGSEGLTAIHSAALGYAPDGAYGKADQEQGRSMKILPSERALETYEHPLSEPTMRLARKRYFPLRPISKVLWDSIKKRVTHC
jgi:hypothetical protein